MHTKSVQYNIPRRFKEFYELHDYIRSKWNIKFKNFPKKTIFSLNSRAGLEKRRKKLNEYIQYLFKRSEQKVIPEFFEFIEISDYTM